MNQIKIFTDSTNDLTTEQLEEMNVVVLPLYVTFEDYAYRDGVDLIPKQLFELVGEQGSLPKTSSASPHDFIAAFQPYIEKGFDIVYIGLSSGISSTIQNAQIAANEFTKGRVEVVDGLNLSSGIGSLVIAACEYSKEGLSAKEIADKIRELVPKVRVAFVIDTLEYLYKGGRCSSLQHFVGSMLKIRPIVKVVDGKMITPQKIRGKKKKALDVMLEAVIQDGQNIAFDRIFITHSLGSEEEAEYLKANLLAHTGVKNIYVTPAGCVISSHCGPKTIGIIYIQK